MDESMYDFIVRHKSELIHHIKLQCPNCEIDGNDYIEDFILNDEGLYNWAISEGVCFD